MLFIKYCQTEKSSILEERNFYTFIVDEKANKIQIKKKIEEKYNVVPLSVNTLITTPKKKPYKRNKKSILGRTSRHKKVIIKLKEEDRLTLYND